MKTTFIVEGKIRGKARPRFTKSGHCFKVKEDSLYEKKIRDAYIASGGVRSDKYIRMELNMYFAVPKSYSKKRRKDCIEGVERPAKKPDCDNVIKNICDGLNPKGEIFKGAYKDDVQVIEIICRKFYTENEEDYIEVILEEI